MPPPDPAKEQPKTETSRGILEATLHGVSDAVRYHRWLADQFTEFLKPPVLEIGAGLGGLTRVLLASIGPIMASEPEPELRAELERVAEPGIQVVAPLVLPMEKTVHITPEPVSIVMSNVLEHIKDDRDAIESLHLLRSVERLVVVVPAHQWAFTGLDEALGHYRRYTKRSLAAVVEGSGWSLESVRYFNPLGALAWTASGRLMGRTTIEPWQTAAVERMLPVLRLAGAVAMGRVLGQSVIALAHRPGSQHWP